MLTVIVKRSFNLRCQKFFGLRTNSSTPGGPLPSLCIRSCWARKGIHFFRIFHFMREWFFRHSDVLTLTPANQHIKILRKIVVFSCYYYVLLRNGSSLLLILNLVIMCDNVVVIGYYYYVFLRIIDLCTKCVQVKVNLKLNSGLLRKFKFKFTCKLIPMNSSFNVL